MHVLHPYGRARYNNSPPCQEDGGLRGSSPVRERGFGGEGCAGKLVSGLRACAHTSANRFSERAKPFRRGVRNAQTLRARKSHIKRIAARHPSSALICMNPCGSPSMTCSS